MEQDEKQLSHGAKVNAEAPKEGAISPKKVFKERLLKKDGTRCKKYVKSTTTHGVEHIFVGKSVIRRLFWLVVVLGAACVCLYNITDRILYFADQPTATTISVSRPGSLTFPVVTVCNLNLVRRSYLESLNINEAISTVVEEGNLSNNGFNASWCTSKLNAELANLGVNVSLDLNTTVIEGRNFFELFVLECSYRGVECKDLPYDPWNSTLTNLGLCYTFNAGEVGEPVTVSGTGRRNGLKLVLNIQQDEYTSLAGDEAGVKISIHPQGTPGAPDDIGIAIPPGRSAFISLRERQVNDRSSNTNCRKRSETGSLNFLSSEYQYYSTTACARDCFLTSIAENCNCIESSLLNSGDEYMGVYSTLPVCGVEDFCCVLNEYKSARSCGMQCPSPCTYTEYSQSVSYAEFPANYITEPLISQLESQLKNNSTTEDAFPSNVAQSLGIYDSITIDRDFLEENLLSVYIYFEDLNFETEVTEDAYSVSALLSDIGGQLGLFVGVSVISMMEFGLWIVDELKDRCCGINEEIIRKWLRTASRRVRGKTRKSSKEDGIELGRLDQGERTSNM